MVKFYVITKSETDVIKEKILFISEIEQVEILDLTEDLIFKRTINFKKIQNSDKDKKNTKTVFNKKSSGISSQTIRVNAKKLDKLVNLVGELIINKTTIFQLAQKVHNTDLINAASFMENITAEIQEVIMKLRMVPIIQVFSRFPRLIRELSK